VHHLTNSDLAKRYKVSEKAVRNWINAAHQGKLDLQLYTYRGKECIANTSANEVIIEDLVKKGRKFINTRARKIIRPKDDFYKIFGRTYVLDLISNLQINRELPRQYNYFDGGAAFWDKYALRLANENVPNILNSTTKLLKINESYFDHQLDKYKFINVIDIGVGNALPVKELLGHLLIRKQLKRYLAIDISKEMLKIAEKTINKWYGEAIHFEGYQLDINYDRFVNALSQDYLGQDAGRTANLILALGGTLGNLRSPDSALKVIHDSMGPNDLFVQTLKLDSPGTRRYFDFNIDQKVQPLAPQYKYLVDLLNIDDSMYDVEMGYAEEARERYLRIKLKIEMTIEFKIGEVVKEVELKKGDYITLWRYLHQDMFEMLHQLDRNNFNTVHVSLINSSEYALTISRIKSNSV